MATKYADIYCMNNIIKNDPRLKKLTDSEKGYLQYTYLKFAISYFMYDCRKDLSARTEPSYGEYTFTGDGISDEFVLSPIPHVDSIFSATVTSNDVTTTVQVDSFDWNTGIAKLVSIPDLGATVKIYSYYDGEFTDDLDEREKNILAEGMNVPYLEEAKNDQNAMKYIVSGKSLRFFSQANHISASMQNVNNQAYNTVDALISEYSYKGSLDKYAGLAKRGSGG